MIARLCPFVQAHQCATGSCSWAEMYLTANYKSSFLSGVVILVPRLNFSLENSNFIFFSRSASLLLSFIRFLDRWIGEDLDLVESSPFLDGLETILEWLETILEGLEIILRGVGEYPRGGIGDYP